MSIPTHKSPAKPTYYQSTGQRTAPGPGRQSQPVDRESKTLLDAQPEHGPVLTPEGRLLLARSDLSHLATLFSEVVGVGAPTMMSFSFLGVMRQAVAQSATTAVRSFGVDIHEALPQLTKDEALMWTALLSAGAWLVVAPVLGTASGLTATLHQAGRDGINILHDLYCNPPEPEISAGTDEKAPAGQNAPPGQVLVGEDEEGNPVYGRKLPERKAETPPFIGRVANEGYLLLLQDLATTMFAIQALAGAWAGTVETMGITRQGGVPPPHTALTAFSGTFDAQRATLAAAVASIVSLAAVYARDGVLDIADAQPLTLDGARRNIIGRSQAGMGFEYSTILGTGWFPTPLAQATQAGAVYLMVSSDMPPQLAGALSGLVGGYLFFSVANQWAENNRQHVLTVAQLEGLAKQAPPRSAERARLAHAAAVARAAQLSEWDPARPLLGFLRNASAAVLATVGTAISVASLRNPDSFSPLQGDVRAALKITLGMSFMIGLVSVGGTMVIVRACARVVGGAGVPRPLTQMIDGKQAPLPDRPGRTQAYGVGLGSGLLCGTIVAMLPPQYALPALAGSAATSAVAPHYLIDPRFTDPAGGTPAPSKDEVRRKRRACMPSVQSIQAAFKDCGSAAFRRLVSVTGPLVSAGASVCESCSPSGMRERAASAGRHTGVQFLIDLASVPVRVALTPVMMAVTLMQQCAGDLPAQGGPGTVEQDDLEAQQQAAISQPDGKQAQTDPAAQTPAQVAGDRARQLKSRHRQVDQLITRDLEDAQAHARDLGRALPGVGTVLTEDTAEVFRTFEKQGQKQPARKVSNKPVALDDKAVDLVRAQWQGVPGQPDRKQEPLASGQTIEPGTEALFLTTPISKD